MSIYPIQINTETGKLNMSFDLNPEYANENLIINHLKFQGIYEIDISNFLLKVLRKGDFVIDVGANIGFFSILSGTLVGPKGKVLSFEPDERNCDRFTSNLRLNKLNNISLIKNPLFDKISEVSFFINSDDSGGSALWNVGDFRGNVKSKKTPQPITMKTTTLDIELKKNKFDNPKLIKVDTEGADQRVLEGARNFLKKTKVPFVISELHVFGLKKMGCSQESFREFMESLGYSTFILSSKYALPKLIPSKTKIESEFIVNILFSTPHALSEYWPIEIAPPSGMQ